ncbi:hypothetical protein IRJ41_007901 [Triplophysa rosa]|uniref:Uncharacterized protein n=1 Tax=Triplophysa rosa TaxID=992332 RepID=A0A9W7W7L4_TRIRA|nr:hypothetical protein IRJ41_007901 [Triplophysa rosa]
MDRAVGSSCLCTPSASVLVPSFTFWMQVVIYGMYASKNVKKKQCKTPILRVLQTDIPSILMWWCLQILEKFSIPRHGQHFGQRFAFWTEEAEQLIAGTLPPIYRIPRPKIVKEEQVEVEEQPLTLKHMYQAEYIVRNSPGLFTGQVQKPSYMLMAHDDQMNASRVLMESTEWDAFHVNF